MSIIFDLRLTSLLVVLPEVKMLLIVRDPIVRLVSDILQYNIRNGVDINVNDIILNTKHQRTPYYGFRKGKIS